jgi:tight adherence protein C
VVPPVILAAWGASAALLVAGLRRRRTASSEDGALAILRALAAVPLPSSIARFGARSGTTGRIREAGLVGVLAESEVARARVAAAALGVMVAAALATLTRAGVVAVPLLLAAGFAAPGRWLAARARARRGAVVRELPDLLDLLAISVEAGMALDPALDLAAARLTGVMAGEVRATRRELSLGTPRREAYAALAERTGVAEVRQVVSALLQAEELGAPLSETLAGQAAGLRAVRRQNARDRAARAAPRIQLVVALVMVPAALLLVMGVLVIELAREVGAVL